MSIEHILNHGGETREKYQNSVVPPIYQSSIFSFNTVDDLRQGIKEEFTTPFYTRGFNPTVAVLRKKLAALEGTDDALVFASGSAAIAASIISETKSGDHIVCVDKPYSWTDKLLTNLLSRFGVETTFVDGREVQNIVNALQDNTRIVYLETPNSVTFELQDIRAVREAVGGEMIIMVDNSYSTPIFQNPKELGADVILHSASKYLSGHSDVVAGVVCADQARIDKIFTDGYMTLGGIISPNDAWLLMKGLRTLKIRVEEVDRVAAKVINYLEKHPKVEKLNYPFADSNPQLALARQQMKGSGGLFSIQVKAKNMKEVEDFCNNLPSFLITCSWGGYESLLFPTCALFDSMNYNNTDLPFNLIRFYIGLEDPDAIIAEFDRAFQTCLS